MLLSLFLSATSLISAYVEPQPRPSPADLVAPLSASLVGLDMQADSLVQGWPLPSQLSTLLVAVQPSTESGMIADVPSLVALQDADGCKPNGNETVEYIIGAPQAPIELTYTTPFVCPSGAMITRKVTHRVSYRTVTMRTTKQQSSPKPGVQCPPLVTSVDFTEIASESWTYGAKPACPGDCCLLVKTVNTKKFAAKVYAGNVQVSQIEIICPDGSHGIQTTKVENFLRDSRNVTVETYAPVCPNVNCPPNTIAGPWNPEIAKVVTTVTNNCKPQ